MSDFSDLQLTADSSKAINALNKLETHLNKTESAANALKNTLKNIGLGIGLGALIKQSLQLSNQFDAMNKRVGSLFGSTMKKELKDLTKNFQLSNKAAKELLTTAGKFGTATGLNGEQLKIFSTDLTKLAADIAAFNGIDDPSQIMEKLARGTMGQTKVLKELGINIDTTSEKFKNQIAAIQATTGATEAQAKQLYILQEAQKQLAYTQGSANSQLNSAWAQLLILFDNFKEILSKVGSILGTLFTPVLEAFNKLFSLPIVQNITAWTVVIGLMIVSLNAIAKSIDTAAAATVNFGTTFTGTTKANMHELLKFELAMKKFQSNIEKTESLKIDRNVLQGLPKMNPAQVQELQRILNNLSKIKGTNYQVLEQLDLVAAKLVNTDLSQIKWSTNAKKAFTEIDQLLTNLKSSGNKSSNKLKNLEQLLIQLGVRSSQTGTNVKQLNTILDDTTKSAGSFTSMFRSIANVFNYIAAIPLTGAGIGAAFAKIKDALGAVGGAALAVGKILLPLIVIFVGLHDVFVSLFGSFKTAAKELSEEDKQLKEQILSKFDETVFWQYENEYELWLSRIWEYTKQFFLDILKLLDDFKKSIFGESSHWWDTFVDALDPFSGAKKLLGKVLDIEFPTDFKTEHTRFKESTQNKIIGNEIDKWQEQYLDKLKLAEIEKEKILAKTEDVKKEILKKELQLAKETLEKIQKEIQNTGKKIKDMNLVQRLFNPASFKKLLDNANALSDKEVSTLRKIKELEEQLTKTEDKTVERDIAKNILSPIQTAVDAVSVDSIAAIKLQSRELVEDKDDKLLTAAKESKEQNGKFFASALQYMKDTKDGLKNITNGNNLQVVNA